MSVSSTYWVHSNWLKRALSELKLVLIDIWTVSNFVGIDRFRCKLKEVHPGPWNRNNNNIAEVMAIAQVTNEKSVRDRAKITWSLRSAMCSWLYEHEHGYLIKLCKLILELNFEFRVHWWVEATKTMMMLMLLL